MKNHKKLLSLLLVLCMLLSLSITAFAASYTGDDVKPGLSGIQPGDELTHPELTDWATLTASWGVRVSFVDWDETELKSEVVPVTDNTTGSSSAPADPTRSGYTFIGWERHDTNNGPATLNDDGTVTGVNGPGPIVFIAQYTPKISNLTITKTFSGLTYDEIPAEDIYFTLTVNGEEMENALYLDKFECENGVYSITIPASVGTYTIEEHNAELGGYKHTCEIPESFEVTENGYTLALENVYTKNTTPPTPPTDPKVGNLTVSKTISGNAADSTKAFDFTVTLSDKTIRGTYGDMTFANGVATFTLKGGESKTASRLPAGLSYAVTEADYSAEGYVTTKIEDIGYIEDGKTIKAVFTNAKSFTTPVQDVITVLEPSTDDVVITEEEIPLAEISVSDDVGIDEGEVPLADVPQTGDDSHLLFWVMVLAICLVSMEGISICNKKGKRI